MQDAPHPRMALDVKQSFEQSALTIQPKFPNYPFAFFYV